MGIGRIFPGGGTTRLFQNFIRGGSKSGKTCFSHSKLNNHLFAKVFKIQGIKAPFFRRPRPQPNYGPLFRHERQRMVVPHFSFGGYYRCITSGVPKLRPAKTFFTKFNIFTKNVLVWENATYPETVTLRKMSVPRTAA